MIKLDDLRKIAPPVTAALSLANKIAFNPDKARSVWSQSYHEFARDTNRHLSFIESNLDRYEFKPSILLEKRVKYKIRKLYISDWRDRIIEIWLNHTLSRALSGKLSRHSYAYRSDGIGLLDCQYEAIDDVKKSQFFIKRDITSFYYTIDQDIMLDFLARFVDRQDSLFSLLEQRIKFQFYGHDRRIHNAPLGLPFGSAVACTLANIYLDDVDKAFEKRPVSYFRYADDFMVCSSDADEIRDCSTLLDQMIADHKLTFGKKKSFDVSFAQADGFHRVNRLTYLGIEYWADGRTRLPIEKRRKIINLVKAVISGTVAKVKKIKSPRAKASVICGHVTSCLKSRIRSAAIIDYFLAHVEDEEQLKSMDKQIAELIRSASTGRKFKHAHFKIVPYGLLRRAGLLSLLHRSRLLRSREIKFSFLSLFNKLTVQRILKSIELRRQRIENIKLLKAARKARQ